MKNKKSVKNKRDLNSLAKQLSAIMKNPLLPDHFYNIITDELAESDVDTDSPEYILAHLKGMREREPEDD